jgi:hypothetical protein
VEEQVRRFQFQLQIEQTFNVLPCPEFLADLGAEDVDEVSEAARGSQPGRHWCR